LSLVLRNEVARTGKLIFTKDDARALEFQIRAPQQYEDLMRLREGLEDAYIERSLRS